MKVVGHAAILAAALMSTAGAASAFELSSSSLGRAGGTIPTKYVGNAMGCGGGNASPALAWRDPPAGTRSFAITMFDPDAPTGHGFWHWIVSNIPVGVTALPEGAGSAGGQGLPPAAVQSRGDAGVSHYVGPCPPPGDTAHRYVITIYAVKTPKLDVGKESSAAAVSSRLRREAIAETSLTYRFGR
jgi:Raf kinase inhibitor-like YbhB/YbcL family protein